MALASKQNRVTGQEKQHNMWFKSLYHNDNPDFVDGKKYEGIKAQRYKTASSSNIYND